METKTINSKQYGSVIYRHIATIYIVPRPAKGRTEEQREKDFEKFWGFIDKGHPVKFFRSAVMIETTRPDLPEQGAVENPWETRVIHLHPYKIWVPVKEDNKDWKKNNMDCNYFKQCGDHRQRTLPVAASQKDVDKFIKAAKDGGALVE